MLAHQSSGTVLAFLNPGTAIGLQLALLLTLVIMLRWWERTPSLAPQRTEDSPASLSRSPL
jgi:hypothetical protein